MKKFLSMFLALVMCLTLTAPVYALEESNSSDSVDVLYIEGQYVQVDNNLSQEKRDELINLMKETNFIPEGIVCDIGQTHGWYDEEKDDKAASYVISPDKFWCTIVSTKLDMPGYDAFKLSAIGQWKNSPTDPIFVFDDVMAMCWSGNLSLYNNSARTFYKTSDGVSHELTNQAVCSKVTPSAGIAYTVPTRVLSNLTYYYLWYIQIDAYIRTPDTVGTANAVAQYAHKYIGGDVIVNFLSNLPDLSFSGAAIDNLSEPGYCELVY